MKRRLEAIPFRALDDAAGYRGAAGAVRDAWVARRHGNESATVVIIEAARAWFGDLGALLDRHNAGNADVTVVRNADGTPSGVYLARAAMLKAIAPAGFVDLKEQWLPRLGLNGRDLRVLELPGRGSLPVRTRSQYLDALLGGDGGDGWIAWGVPPARPVSLIHKAARVNPAARVFGSVVAAGARVGREAIVARSVIGPGAVVGNGERVVDAVVPGPVGWRPEPEFDGGDPEPAEAVAAGAASA